MKPLAHPWTRLLALLLICACGPARGDGVAIELDLDGALGVATAEYIIGGIEDAEARGADLVIIRMDTPGGLMEPMRDIIQAILGADLPVVTYVSPNGARADSAGTFIVIASHVAAMAPTTHLGAATPVSMTGDFSPGDESPDQDSKDDDEAADDANADSENADDADSGDDATDETGAGDRNNRRDPAPSDTAMERKVLNDAISYIRGLAEANGRNADWAEAAVRNAATLTAREALDENVIDIIAVDRADLLRQLDGREVKVKSGSVTLATEGMTVENVEPNWRLKILNAIASPEIAVLLLMVGMYGLLLEGYSPGAILPGVVGVICLLLAAYALQVLPVNYAGLALIVVGVALLVGEAFAPSFGVLGIGGITAIIFGSIMMFDSGIPGFGISLQFVTGLAIVAGGALIWLTSYLVKLRRTRVVVGRETLVGAVAVATESFDGNGHVWLESESWAAHSRVPVDKGQQVRVAGIDGLVLSVEPVGDSSPIGESG